MRKGNPHAVSIYLISLSLLTYYDPPSENRLNEALPQFRGSSSCCEFPESDLLGLPGSSLQPRGCCMASPLPIPANGMAPGISWLVLDFQ